jgi:hypothetical protein
MTPLHSVSQIFELATSNVKEGEVNRSIKITYAGFNTVHSIFWTTEISGGLRYHVLHRSLYETDKMT